MTDFGRPLTSHKLLHQDGGGDEISVALLSGQLADEQLSSWDGVSGKPSTFSPSAHKAIHQDGGSDKLNCALLSGRINYVDRGDPSAYDKQLSDLITDATWRDLDLSSIVPSSATFIYIKVIVADDAVASRIRLRKKGNLNIHSCQEIHTEVAGIYVTSSFFVPCDANRVIQYNATNVTWTNIWIAVLGWLI